LLAEFFNTIGAFPALLAIRAKVASQFVFSDLRHDVFLRRINDDSWGQPLRAKSWISSSLAFSFARLWRLHMGCRPWPRAASADPQRQKIPAAPPLPIPRFPQPRSRRFGVKFKRFLEVSNWLRARAVRAEIGHLGYPGRAQSAPPHPWHVLRVRRKSHRRSRQPRYRACASAVRSPDNARRFRTRCPKSPDRCSKSHWLPCRPQRHPARQGGFETPPCEDDDRICQVSRGVTLKPKPKGMDGQFWSLQPITDDRFE
jgi:hypothetical protein